MTNDMSDFQSNRVFVGNLSYEVRWQDLKDFMSTAGPVAHADVLMQGNGHSRGCGIVEFETPEGAQAAIETLNNESLRGRPVFIREDREPLGVGASVHSLSKGGIPNAVFVENLAFSTSWPDLKDHFRGAGNVLRADVHHYNGRSKGRGTVVFEDAAGVDAAIAQLNGSMLHGRALRVRKDLPQEQRPTGSYTADVPPSASLFVKNLPWSTTDEELAQLVGNVVPVLGAHIRLLANGRSAGSGTVQTQSVEDATQAISQLNGVTFGDRKLTVAYSNE